MSDGFDFPGTRQALSELIRQRQFERSTAGSIQKQQLQKIVEDRAAWQSAIEGISQAANPMDAMRAYAKVRPDLYLQSMYQQDVQRKVMENLASKDYDAAAVLLGKPEMAPTIAGERAMAAVPAQEAVEAARARGRISEEYARRKTGRERLWAGMLEVGFVGPEGKPATPEQLKATEKQYLRTGQLGDLTLRQEAAGGLEGIYAQTRLRNLAKQRSNLEKIPAILDTIASEFLQLDPGSGLKGKTEGITKSLLSEFGADQLAGYSGLVGVKSFKDVSKSMSVQLARALGDVGNISVQERALNEKLLPKVTDTREVGIKKIELLKKLVNAILSQNSDEMKKAVTGAGLDYSEITTATGAEGGIITTEVTTPAGDAGFDYQSHIRRHLRIE